ncbi:MAG: glycosyltransferase family 4 protein [Reyranellaceae bacterium]
MRRAGLFHPGRQHSWQTAAALGEAGALAWHATAIYYDPARLPYRAADLVPGPAGARLRALLRRRASPMLDPARIRHVPAMEWTEQALARAGWRGGAGQANRIGNALFQRGVLKLFRREPVELLWGYDTSCDFLFSRPETQSAVRVLDQAGGHACAVRQIMLQQRERHPEWFAGDSDIPDAQEVARADRESRHCSHAVVGARHAAATLVARGMAGERVHVVPYGYDETRFPAAPIERSGLGGLPVRFVFVGAVGPRKGVHLLLQAFRGIPARLASLRLVGPLAMPERLLRGAGENVEYCPALPHDRIVEEYARAHCFVFPTLIDGGGIVLYEAAACGLGIVQSPTCGDGVRNGPLGSNGIVLREASVDALREAIERVVANPAILRDWSAASWAMRQERSWSAYRKRIVELLPRLV